MKTMIRALTIAAGLGVIAFGGVAVFGAGALAADAALPEWAYPVAPPNPPGFQPPPPDMTPRHVPNSSATFVIGQTRDLFFAPDWHPDNHPPLPSVVSKGRKPGVFACAFCHLPNGLGRPENASLAGLPAEYIIRQVQDLKSGARKTAHPSMLPPTLMASIAKAVNDDELKEAAAYFSSLKLTPWIRVVETDTVPKVKVVAAMYVPVDGTEPIGKRIVELPESFERTELRDSASGFVAYVPKGSLKKGAAIAAGGKKGFQCAACHGDDLRGLGPVPRLAGRSPSYLMRQLQDIKHGTRAGPWSPLMKQVVDTLNDDDLLAVVAYVSSQKP